MSDLKRLSDGLGRAMAFTRRGAIAAGTVAAAACTVGAASSPGRAIFRHGVASGDPESDRVVIWTRATPPAAAPAAEVDVRWIVARDRELQQVVRQGLVRTGAARDWTVKVDVTGLRPGRTWHYGFKAGGETSPVGRTATAPSRRAEVAALKIAVVSCSNYPAGWFNAYRAIATRGDVDLVLHLGDYIYEYGPGQYATEWGRTVGRVPDPPREILTLADYRLRFAQYRADPDLQAAHACAPWLVTWDDHETSNDAWEGGAENHDADKEGPWTARKAAALQAYYEWMPIREPAPGAAFDAINRSFDWGRLVTIAMLETRLLARARPLDFEKDLPFRPFDVSSGAPVPIVDPARLAGLDPRNPPQGVRMLPDLAPFTRERLNDPNRQLLGATQEAWLGKTLAASRAGGTRWQLLGNQVIMAKVKSPDFKRALATETQARVIENYPPAKAFFELASLGVPFNLDAWDGYPAARERLYALAKAADARLVVCTGDTHSAWANALTDQTGELRGVEFGCTSVTSPSIGDMFAGFGVDPAQLGDAIAQANADVLWHDERRKGYTLVTLTPQTARADFLEVDTIVSRDFTVSTGRSFETDWAEGGVRPLRQV
jgi:alkaline phosphatase D